MSCVRIKFNWVKANLLFVLGLDCDDLGGGRLGEFVFEFKGLERWEPLDFCASGKGDQGVLRPGLSL